MNELIKLVQMKLQTHSRHSSFKYNAIQATIHPLFVYISTTKKRTRKKAGAGQQPKKEHTRTLTNAQKQFASKCKNRKKNQSF